MHHIHNCVAYVHVKAKMQHLSIIGFCVSKLNFEKIAKICQYNLRWATSNEMVHQHHVIGSHNSGKTNYIPSTSIVVTKVICSHELLITCTWIINDHQVWPLLWKPMFWQFCRSESSRCFSTVPKRKDTSMSSQKGCFSFHQSRKGYNIQFSNIRLLLFQCVHAVRPCNA